MLCILGKPFVFKKQQDLSEISGKTEVERIISTRTINYSQITQ